MQCDTGDVDLSSIIDLDSRSAGHADLFRTHSAEQSSALSPAPLPTRSTQHLDLCDARNIWACNKETHTHRAFGGRTLNLCLLAAGVMITSGAVQEVNLVEAINCVNAWQQVCKGLETKLFGKSQSRPES